VHLAVSKEEEVEQE